MYARRSGHGAVGAQGERDLVEQTAIDAAHYICRRLPKVPKTSYVKLMYLADREYGQRHGRTLTGVTWWAEKYGPLNASVTKLVEGPEFAQERSLTVFGTSRISITEAEAGEFRHLGSAELSVLDLVLAEYGSLPQAELLARVHALPEVANAPMKSKIEPPMRVSRPGSAEYFSELAREIQREQDAHLYENLAVPADEFEARHAEAEALVRLITA